MYVSLWNVYGNLIKLRKCQSCIILNPPKILTEEFPKARILHNIYCRLIAYHIVQSIKRQGHNEKPSFHKRIMLIQNPEVLTAFILRGNIFFKKKVHNIKSINLKIKINFNIDPSSSSSVSSSLYSIFEKSTIHIISAINFFFIFLCILFLYIKYKRKKTFFLIFFI